VSDDEIRKLNDIEEIKQLKARSVRFIDTKQWSSWAADVLAPEYRMEGDGGVHEGRDDVVAFVSGALADATTVHHCHTPEITLTGADTATGIWAMYDYVSWPGEGALVLRGYGHYHEEYVRTAAGWLLAQTVASRLRVDQEGSFPGLGGAG
jgi:hypothetical protein